MLAGGYKKHDNHQNDAQVQEAAKFAVKEICSKSGEKLELVKVQSASTQVVAGKNYKLVLDLATKDQKVQPYEATVYEPLGGQDKQLTDYKAIDKANAEMATETSSERQSGALLGGSMEIDTDNQEAMKAAEFAVKQLNQQSNSLAPLELKKILSVQEKVSSGRHWIVTMELSQGPGALQVYEVMVLQSVSKDYKLVSSKKSN